MQIQSGLLRRKISAVPEGTMIQPKMMLEFNPKLGVTKELPFTSVKVVYMPLEVECAAKSFGTS